ncbi:hypothetical protein HPB47_004682, partial [Ixodes persulcatus]
HWRQTAKDRRAGTSALHRLHGRGALYNVTARFRAYLEKVLELVYSLLDDILSVEQRDDETTDALVLLKEQCHLLLKRNNAV